MITGALIVGPYRYHLERRWGTGSMINFIMLNPSTADAEQDDPTIRRCIGFAKDWGHDALNVTNLFAVRATKPADMMKADDPVGEENDKHIVSTAMVADRVVLAWGEHGKHMNRGADVRQLLINYGIEAYCLGRSAKGQPMHPLYRPKNTSLERIDA